MDGVARLLRRERHAHPAGDHLCVIRRPASTYVPSLGHQPPRATCTKRCPGPALWFGEQRPIAEDGYRPSIVHCVVQTRRQRALHPRGEFLRVFLGVVQITGKSFPILIYNPFAAAGRASACRGMNSSVHTRPAKSTATSGVSLESCSSTGKSYVRRQMIAHSWVGQRS